MIYYTIIKQTAGNVVIADSATNLILFSFVNVNALEVKNNDEVIVKFGFNQWKSIFASQVKFTQVEPNAAQPFTGDSYDLINLLSSSFFFELSGGGSQNLNQVLTVGNSAGTNDIDLNNNDLLNVDTITATGDLILNPSGSINCNGQTIDMTGGEIQKVPLIHGQNNNNITLEALGTGDLILKTNNVNRLILTDTGVFKGLPIDIQVAASDETTALTTGVKKVIFRSPAAFTLSEVRASLSTAQTSGSIFTVDINLGGSSVLGTNLTIDNNETTSVTAATPATITNSNITDDGEISIDIDQIGNGTAKGLKVTLIGYIA